MQYTSVVTGYFIERPNRFIAMVEIQGQVQRCHVRNTGRCRELLVPGAQVFLERAQNPNRATAYSLIGVRKGERLINMDSQAPNLAAYEWIKAEKLLNGVVSVRREVTWGNSRFDLYVCYEGGHKEAFIEVKGVTLEREGVVLFPDAPTKRGAKHLKELIKARQEGYEAWLLLVVQMSGVQYFCPNEETDAVFAQALVSAAQAGVHITAVECTVTPDSMEITEELPVHLTQNMKYR